MDNQTTKLDFAFIGHQDSWSRIDDFVNKIRTDANLSSISIQEIKKIFSYIPPRSLFELDACSTRGDHVHGIYIETFISPDEAGVKYLHANLKKIKDACNYAAALGAPVVALGGMTSIILENALSPLTQIGNTNFTTGNSLTAAFIVKGIEKSCEQRGMILKELNLQVIGSTGDIGSACVRYFTGKVANIFLNAQQPGPLQKQSAEIIFAKQQNEFSTNPNDFLSHADILICAASSLVENCKLFLLPVHAIICDAGFPKNLHYSSKHKNQQWFAGGLGHLQAGIRTTPSGYKELYQFHTPNITYGCLLEAIVLAMDRKPVSFSAGRGKITVEAMENIYAMAKKHGINEAALVNNAHPENEFSNQLL